WKIMAERKTYHGGCHCGAVRFEAETDLSGQADCNCSRCQRLGWVMQAVPASDFRLLSGSDSLRDYRFNTDTIAHLFCTNCGIESFGRGTDRNGTETYMINVNCLEDAPTVDRSTITHFDGRSF